MFIRNRLSEWVISAFAFPAIAKTSTHLPTPEGWKAELDWVAGYVVRQFTCTKAVIHSITSDVDKDWTVDMQGQEQGQGQGPSLQGPGQGQD